MTKCRFFSILISGAILGLPLSAAIDVTNNSGLQIRVSFHGKGCSYFESDHLSYAPCAEKEIPVNETARFADMLYDSPELTKTERAIVPRINFSFFGLPSYSCKVQDFRVKEVCSSKVTLDEDHCPAPATEIAKQTSALVAKSVLLILPGTGLSITENYLLTVLPGYEYYPKPAVECIVTQIRYRSEPCLC